MNILLLTTRLNLGGIGVYTASLARALKKKGVEVIVASSGGELTDELKKNNIEHINLAIDTSADIGAHTLMAYFRLSSLIRERGIQLIHAQTRVTQVIAHLLSKREKVAFISTCHGFFKRRWFRRLLPCWGERAIAISDAVREHLVNDMKVSKDRIRIIYNGIDIERFNRAPSFGEKSLIRNQLGLKEHSTIGIISRLSDVKGHKYLFGAFARMSHKFPGLQLLVIGDGPPGYTKELKALAESLGIEDRVLFHQACRDTSIPLSVIDVFCMPSLQEGLGLSIIEAMASGLPVVASNVGGIYSLIKHGENGLLVSPKDEDGLAEAISEILNNPSLAKKMGNISKELVKEKFGLDLMAEKTLKLYQEVIDAANVGDRPFGRE